MLVSQLRALLRSKFGKKNVKLDTILEEKLSFKKYGTGKTTMEVESIINSEDSEFP
jgi:hypothetical protein